MNRSEHLLTILGEECVEVAKEVSKALRFSLDEKMVGHTLTNRQRIQSELQDLYCVVIILQEEGILDADGYNIPRVYPELLVRKRKKIEEYFERSFQYGALTP